VKWAVCVAGEPAGLRTLSEALRGGDTQTLEKDGTFVLCSTQFDSCPCSLSQPFSILRGLWSAYRSLELTERSNIIDPLILSRIGCKPLSKTQP